MWAPLAALLGVFGASGIYQQPHYQVLRTIAPHCELRSYGARLAAQATAPRSGQAFGMLFRYIGGANRTHAAIEMTAPVEMQSRTIAMTAPVQTERAPGGMVMRFFLPRSLTLATAPVPVDPHVQVVTVPAQTVAALRFSGTLDAASIAEHERTLRADVAAAGESMRGAPFVLAYDPPFTIPLLRRNEVAVVVAVPSPD